MAKKRAEKLAENGPDQALRNVQGNDRASRGFTLIELAIVLVIFGLVLTGILVGARVVLNARTTTLLNELTTLTAGVQTYKQRYGIPPGQDQAAEIRFGSKVNQGGIFFEMKNGSGPDAKLDGDTMDAETREAVKPDSSASATLMMRAAGIIPPFKRNPGRTHPYMQNPFDGVYGFAFNPMDIPDKVNLGYSVCATNLPLGAATAALARFGNGVPDDEDGLARAIEMVPNPPTGNAPLWEKNTNVYTQPETTLNDDEKANTFVVCVRAFER